MDGLLPVVEVRSIFWRLSIFLIVLPRMMSFNFTDRGPFYVMFINADDKGEGGNCDHVEHFFFFGM